MPINSNSMNGSVCRNGAVLVPAVESTDPTKCEMAGDTVTLSTVFLETPCHTRVFCLDLSE